MENFLKENKHEKTRGHVFEPQKETQKEDLAESKKSFCLKIKKDLRSNDKYFLKEKDFPITEAKNREDVRNSNEFFCLKVNSKNQVELDRQDGKSKHKDQTKAPGFSRKTQETRNFSQKSSEKRNEKSEKPETKDGKSKRSDYLNKSDLHPVPDFQNKCSESQKNPFPVSSNKLSLKTVNFLEIKSSKTKNSRVLEIDTCLDGDQQPVLSIYPNLDFSTPQNRPSVAIQTSFRSPSKKFSQKNLISSIVEANCRQFQMKIDSKFALLNKNLGFIETRISEAQARVVKQRLQSSSREKLVSKFRQMSSVPISVTQKSTADSLTRSWAEVTRLIRSGQVNEGFSKCISMKDDIYLLRLMHHTEPCFQLLHPDLAKKVFQVLVKILDSRFVEVIGSQWLDESAKLFG